MKFIITGLDVTLFLLETLLKAAGTILVDGGSLAASRAVETISGWAILDVLYTRSNGNSRWKTYEQFRKSEFSASEK